MERATRYSSEEAATRAALDFILGAVAHWNGDVKHVAFVYGDWEVVEVDGTA